MPQKLTGLSVPLVELPEGAPLREAAALALGVQTAQILAVEPLKRSLDARQRPPGPHWVFSVLVFLEGEEDALSQHIQQTLARLSAETRVFTPPHIAPEVFARRPGFAHDKRPIVVGSGPAGLFAALTFAEHGVPCLLIERGKTLRGRHLDVRTFRRRGELNPESNLCFGEGGAGTYSDGKLYTRKHHPLVRTIYERLVAFGGTPDILVHAHPHIGTNKLYEILDGIRAQILERGCEIRFETRLSDLWVEGGQLRGVKVQPAHAPADAPEEDVPAGLVVLATGHSARDVYAMLARRGVEMVQKPFAIGARAEHPQQLVDGIQLGQVRQAPGVEPAEYFLASHADERSVYSFCMCPGGYIIPTPTEPGHLNVNGMSNSNRGGHFANAALVATVEPRDYWIERPGDLDHLGVLAGLAFQREWERRAFEAGGRTYCAPAQRFTDLVSGRKTGALPARTSYRPGLVPGDLTEVLPASVVTALRRAIRDIDRKRMRGYYTEDAILVGVETTTSSPIRVSRAEDRQSPSLPGLYPCGEGAGFSGGIVSSAIEGVETALAALAHKFEQFSQSNREP